MSTAGRYAAMFAALAPRREGAFVPFLVLGDPDLATSLAALESLVAGGADAVEVGIPFSDPIADGPVIQAAATRALAAGARPEGCWEIVRTLRVAHPALPIGVLCYANLVVRAGAARFYAAAAAAGADSILLADVPMDEAAPFRAAAAAAGIAFVATVPPSATPRVVEAVARGAQGYSYVVSRPGVTGADSAPRHEAAALIARLRSLGAPPPLLGFGIATPDHVREAMTMGAAGAITGSAVVERIVRLRADRSAGLAGLTAFVTAMKAATRPRGAPPGMPNTAPD
jgi:tryptophan synthase alpha chain